MGRCMLGGLLIFVAMSLGTEAGGFAPSTPSDAGVRPADWTLPRSPLAMGRHRSCRGAMVLR